MKIAMGKMLRSKNLNKDNKVPPKDFESLLIRSPTKRIINQKTELKAYQRREDTKDFQHNLMKDFSKFFGIVIKILIMIYLLGLLENTFLGMNFDLSKFEIIIYTFLTTSLGVLIDRHLIKEKE